VLDREDASVGGVHEEPSEVAERRVADGLRRPHRSAHELQGRRVGRLTRIGQRYSLASGAWQTASSLKPCGSSQYVA
jgi:hypothetical protein